MPVDNSSELDSFTTMRQYAPFPKVLADLVADLKYRPGWHFELKDIERDHAGVHEGAAGGLTFIGVTGTQWSNGYEGAMDAYHPDRPRPVYFYFPVPAATYDERSWRRWLFDRLIDVETHEAMEYFQIGNERPYSPSHGPGNDPYMIREVGTNLDKRTAFTGKVNDGI